MSPNNTLEAPTKKRPKRAMLTPTKNNINKTSKLYRLLSFFKNPLAKLIASTFLMVAALLELFETAFEDFMQIEIKVHFGIIFFGISRVLIALSEIIESKKGLFESKSRT